MTMLRVLAIGTVLAAALWGGWWWIGATGVERGVEAAADAARAQGWDVAWDDLSVSGFPNRFDTTITAPAVAPPDGGWRWTAPFFQVFALSYRPNHVIAVAPPEQVVTGPAGTLRVTENDLRASAVIEPGPDLALRRATVAGRGLAFDWGGAVVTVSAAQVALRKAADGPPAYDLAIGLEGLVPPGGLIGAVDPEGRLPASIGALTLDATATFDRPIDRHLRGPLGIEALTINGARLRWGPLNLMVTGDLAADAAGLAQGALQATLDADGIDALTSLAEPFLTGGQGALLRAAINGLAAGGDATLTLPVEAGTVRFGLLPLAALPPLDPPDA